MKIPDSFKNAIKNAFYDKICDVYRVSYIDDEGSQIEGPLELIETIDSCNVQMQGGGINYESNGLSLKADIRVSCLDTKAIENDVIEYLNKKYEIKKRNDRDSHVELFGELQ